MGAQSGMKVSYESRRGVYPYNRRIVDFLWNSSLFYFFRPASLIRALFMHVQQSKIES
jgi:hypothetical protein